MNVVDVKESEEHLTERPPTKTQPAVSPLVSANPDCRFNGLITTMQGCCTNVIAMNAIIKVSDYQGNATPDKNGLMPLFCSPVAGSYPRSLMVLAGSSAEMHGFESGKTYIVSINDTNRKREYETHDGNRGVSKVWNVINLGEVTSPIEILQASALIGDSNVIDDVLIGDAINKAQEPVTE